MTSESTNAGDPVVRLHRVNVVSAPGIVSIWAGRLENEDALGDYVAFRYPPAGEGWSPFTRDHGLDGIDEDFAEAAWWLEGTCSFAEHSYGDSFADAAHADLVERFPEANSAYLLYDVDVTALGATDSARLTLLGAYPYRQ